MKMKKVLGGVAAAAMLACLAPVSGTAMAADASCDLFFNVNGYSVEYTAGVKQGATCELNVAQAAAVLGDTLEVPTGKVISGWTLNGFHVSSAAKVSEPEFQGQTLVATLKNAPTHHFIVHTNGGTLVEGENAGQLGDFQYDFADGEAFLNKLPKVSRLDYVFKGWTYADGTAVKAADKATADTEVFAKWEPAEVDPGMQVETFTLTVSTNGGAIKGGEYDGWSGDVQYTVGQNEKLGSVLPKVTRQDYVFKGWSYDKAGYSKVLDSDFISADTHVYAQWEPAEVDPGMQVETFTLTVSTNGGAIKGGEYDGWSGDVQYTVGQNEKLGSVLPKVTRQDYVFKGWSYDKAGHSKVLDSDFISADTHVYAQWEPAEVDPGMQVETFTLTVSTNGGAIKGGDYDGWSGDIQYTVGQNEKLGSVLPKVVRQDYVLTGWSYDEAGQSKVLDSDFISADTHVYAQWEPAEVDPGMQVETFTLTVSTKGGAIKGGDYDGWSGDIQYTVGQNEKLGSVLPKVVRQDYVLAGWSYDEAGQSKVLDSDFISADTHVYAQWTPAEVDPGMQVEQFNVVYNLNGGHFKGSSQVGDYSVQVAQGDTLLDKLPTSKQVTKKGYKLVGWVYSETGKKVKKTDRVNGNIYKVVAKWQKKHFWEYPGEWWPWWPWQGARLY